MITNKTTTAWVSGLVGAPKLSCDCDKLTEEVPIEPTNYCIEEIFDLLKKSGSEDPDLELKIFLEQIGAIGDERQDCDLDRCKKFTELIDAIKRNQPIQHLAGYTYVASKKILVDKCVLLPGPELDIVIDLANRYILPGFRVLELCTGSGAISCVLGILNLHSMFYATDISPEALSVCRRNIEFHNLKNVRTLCGDLFDPVLESSLKKFDMIISNPPYCRTGDIPHLPKQLRDYTPRLAIDGGEDGLMFHRAIISQASRFLKGGGYIVLENEAGQSQSVKSLLEFNGFEVLEIRKNKRGEARVISGRLGR